MEDKRANLPKLMFEENFVATQEQSLCG